MTKKERAEICRIAGVADQKGVDLTGLLAVVGLQIGVCNKTGDWVVLTLDCREVGRVS